MRLCERTRLEIEIAPRIREAGALGGLAERFSHERVSMMATVLPMEAALQARERGAIGQERLRLLLPKDAVISLGDGVVLKGGMYRVCSVAGWTAHWEVICEAIV